jgi:tetratricopeptide (TPR) repeat protein
MRTLILLITSLCLYVTAFTQVSTFENDKLVYDYAKNLYQTEQYTELINYLDQQGLSSSELRKLYAMGHQALAQFEQAINDYTEAIQKNRRDPELYINRAKCYYNRKDFNKALGDYLEANRLSNSDYTMDDIGRTHHYLGYYKEAIKDFKKELEKEYSKMAHIYLLSSLFRDNNFSELKYYSDSLLRNNRNSNYFLLSDSTLFYYVTTLNQISNNIISDYSINNIERALSNYKNNDDRIFQGLYYDELAVKAYLQNSLGHDSASYQSYKQLLNGNNNHDVTLKLQELKKKLKMDVTGPVISILNPTFNTDNSVTIPATKRSPFYGQATDSSGVAEVKVNDQLIRKIEEDGGFNIELTLHPGGNIIRVSAIDKYENISEKIYTINVSAEEAKSETLADIPFLLNSIDYHAIIIAEQDYNDDGFIDLKKPISDAKDLKDILMKNYTFPEKNIMLLSNVGRTALLDSIEKKCNTLKDNDNLLIFYAGHGDKKTVGGQITGGYLIPTDAKKGSWSSYINSEDLKQSIKYSPAKHILLIVDACFAGALLRSDEEYAPESIINLWKIPSRRMLTSGNVEAVSDNGKFIQTVKDWLKNDTGKWKSAIDLYQFVQKNSDNDYSPQFERFGEGDRGGAFIFIHR